jgi:membrane-associated phospholipid phosphatase
MHDEKHYFTDVAVGAAVGTAMGVLMYRGHWGSDPSEHQDVSFIFLNGAPMISCTIRL